MAATSPDTANISIGPGVLWYASLGTTEPTTHIAAWPAGWLRVGYTAEGHQGSYALTIADVEVAELLDPVRRITTKRDLRVAFAMAELTSNNLKLALNGGSLAAMAGGVGSWFTPPDVGSEVRHMLGWDSDDATERIIWRRVLQAGTMTVPRRKGAEFARFTTEFALEQPGAGVKPFAWGLDSARVSA